MKNPIRCKESIVETKSRGFFIFASLIVSPILAPESVIILDNASFHKSPKLEIIAKENGHRLLYLPAYSPDFNPIEHWWAKIKNQIRKKMRDLSTKLRIAMDYVLRKLSIA